MNITTKNAITGESIRTTVSEVQKTNDYDTRQSHGVSIDAAYYQPKAKRLVVEYYSIWENRETHGVVGTYYMHYDDVTLEILAEANSVSELREILTLPHC